MEETLKARGTETKKKKKEFSLLYVDDEATNLRVFKSNFRKIYNVFTCESPFEAIELLKHEPIQIIITDQRMPDMTGTEFLEKIVPDFPDVIKIILTGFTDIEAIQDGINKCGIYKYVTKPWNFDEMKGLLERAIETYKKNTEGDEQIKELADTNQELEEKIKERTRDLNKMNKRLVNSIRYAGLLQQSMLPSNRSFARQFSDHFFVFDTKYLVSEEFFWTTRINFRSENYSVLALVEFDGKGIVGSLKTLITDSIFSFIVHDRKIYHSGEIINELKYELDAAGSMELKCDINVSVAVFDHNENTLQFSGINQDMMIVNNGEVKILKGESVDHFNDATADKIEIMPDSSYYLYTDGYYNQQNPDGVAFSYEKFSELIKSIENKPMSEQKDFLMNNISNWKEGSDDSDDVCIFGFKL